MTVIDSTGFGIQPNKALGGGTPDMLCETEIGAKQVRLVLQALKGGAA